MFDVPALLEPLAREKGVSLSPLGAWNADDLAAEDIATRVRAVSEYAATPAPARAL